MTYRKSYPTKLVKELTVGDKFPDGGEVAHVSRVGEKYFINVTNPTYGGTNLFEYRGEWRLRVMEEAKKESPGAHRK